MSDLLLDLFPLFLSLHLTVIVRCSLFLLGFGFYAAESVVASSCKPHGSASTEAVTITSGSTTEATSTILETSTIAVSETTATVELITTTATSEDITTTNAGAEDTTTLIETFAATISAGATTSEARAGEPTYVLSASGGSLNGAQAHGIGRQGSWISFNPATISGSTIRKSSSTPLDDFRTLRHRPTSAHTITALPTLLLHLMSRSVWLVPLAEVKDRNISPARLITETLHAQHPESFVRLMLMTKLHPGLVEDW
ncbi:unnamed protein product [Fusarium equiseti]|uniref:Uncharacterized protein n=1 Tax=Fusarium equiseti TaxID=61235 RepID=A0A8J2IKU0_FUSEQ|nr:unnamed protein product [Fusarium equiseti]